MFVFARAVHIVVVSSLVASLPLAASAQGAPSVLQSGENAASADSLIGPHAYTFHALPGHFTVTIDGATTSRDSVPGGDSIGGSLGVRVKYLAYAKGDSWQASRTTTGIAVRGTVVRPTSVVLTVVPPNSPLVRVAKNFVMQATGNVAFAGITGDPIVGPYIAKMNAYGATRFNANGSFVTSDGHEGRWVLFDAGLHIYSLQIESFRMTLKLVPGRGLVNASDDLLVFEAAH